MAAGAVGETVSGVVENAQAAVDVKTILPMIKEGVAGVFDIASSAFSFLLSNPLCAFMMGSGFAFTALGLVRKGLRIAKRV